MSQTHPPTPHSLLFPSDSPDRCSGYRFFEALSKWSLSSELSSLPQSSCFLSLPWVLRVSKPEVSEVSRPVRVADPSPALFVVTFGAAASGHRGCPRQPCLSEGQTVLQVSVCSRHTQCPLSPPGQKGALLQSGDSGSAGVMFVACTSPTWHLPTPVGWPEAGWGGGAGRSGPGSPLLSTSDLPPTADLSLHLVSSYRSFPGSTSPTPKPSNALT